MDTSVPNATNSESISGWAAQADGTLVKVPGSPYSATGEYNIGTAQNFLFATEAEQIAAWNIQSDGSLTAGPVSSAPFEGTAEEGPLSVSFDLTQKDLYANYSMNGTYQAYSIGSNGSISFINYAAADESSSWLSFTANDALAYQTDCYHGGAAMWGYSRSSSGGLTLTYNPQQPPQPTGLSSGSYCPFGAATIGNTNVIIAEQPTNAITPTGPWQMVNFTIASDGSLSTTDTASTAPTVTVGNVEDYRFDPTQTWLAVGGDSGIQIFHWANGKLVSSGTFAVPNGVRFVRWDNAGHLFALAGTSGQPSSLYVFNVVNGVPTPAPGSPVPLTGNSQGLAVKPLS